MEVLEARSVLVGPYLHLRWDLASWRLHARPVEYLGSSWGEIERGYPPSVVEDDMGGRSYEEQSDEEDS